MERIKLCSIEDMFIMVSLWRDMYFGRKHLKVEDSPFKAVSCVVLDVYPGSSREYDLRQSPLLPEGWDSDDDYPAKTLSEHLPLAAKLPTVNELWFVLGHYMHSGEADGSCYLVKQESGWVFELRPGSGREWWDNFNPTGEFIGSHWKRPLCLSRYRTYCKELTNGN